MSKRVRRLWDGVAHGIAGRVDELVISHHHRRLRRAGWEGALDASGFAFSAQAAAPAGGNAVELLVDGAQMLPIVARELAAATSHVHLAGWHFTPDLDLTREETPVFLNSLLAELAERVDVRVLAWGGAPFRLFRPSRADVRKMVAQLTGETSISCVVESARFAHCHHEKVIVVDDRVAFVGGIDLTTDGGDPFDSILHEARGEIGWHDAAIRIEGPAVTAVAEHFRMRWRGATRELLPAPQPAEPAGEITLQVVRTVPEKIYDDAPRGEFSILESYCGALRAAEKFVYLENQFLWSPEIVSILAEKLRNPPCDEFRVVTLLPARPNDGADVSRGQIAALIEADDGDERFLACTVYARRGDLRDLVYIHAKIAIVDDRWFTVGSANLNEHSLFNDTEMNVVSHDPSLARAARLGLWAEHLETSEHEVAGDPAEIVDRLWKPIASEQLERSQAGLPLTHRLVKLPGVSRRRARISGSLQGRIFDL